MTKIIKESFSIQFSGQAFDSHDIPASALAQSLLALDGLTRRAAEAVYGKDAEAEIKVKAGFRQGSFIVDLIAACKDDPVAAAAGSAASACSAVQILKEIVKLRKFAKEKKVSVSNSSCEKENIKVISENREISCFDIRTANAYNQASTQSQFSQLSQIFDQSGAESIKIYTADDDSTEEVITKEDRKFFRHEDGIVLTDNEAEVFLEVIGPMTNGSPDGWRFSEGIDGLEFVANVEDDSF